ncbi:MAG: ABC transporter ATP-binding protein [Acidobacteriota bacterium]
MGSGNDALVARNLTKAYGNLRAVDGVSLTLAAGEIVGLLGPNGAGKTTTVSMLAGIAPPDGGQVLLGGKPLMAGRPEARGDLGLVPQELALYEGLSAGENLRLFGALYGLGGRDLSDAMGRALRFVGLADRAGHRVKTFSGGMKRRLNLAAGLLHEPAILLLDEPTVGVDPQSRNAIFDLLEELKGRGKALLYTTHYMEEAERLCDRIVIMDHGQILAEGTARSLAEGLGAPARLTAQISGAPGDAGWLEALRTLPGVTGAAFEEGRLVVDLSDLAPTVPSVLDEMRARGVLYSSLSTERPGLEAVFLALTGKELRDP